MHKPKARSRLAGSSRCSRYLHPVVRLRFPYGVPYAFLPHCGRMFAEQFLDYFRMRNAVLILRETMHRAVDSWGLEPVEFLPQESKILPDVCRHTVAIK